MLLVAHLAHHGAFIMCGLRAFQYEDRSVHQVGAWRWWLEATSKLQATLHIAINQSPRDEHLSGDEVARLAGFGHRHVVHGAELDHLLGDVRQCT